MSDSDGGHDAVVILATGIVLVLGASFSALIVLFVAERATQALLISSCVMSASLLLMFLLRSDSDNRVADKDKKWFGLFSRRKAKDRYKVRKGRGRKPPVEEFGTNLPPSAKSIREIKEISDGTRNWSPRETDPDAGTGK